MRKQKGAADFGFTSKDMERLQKALLQIKGTRVYMRLKAVLLVAEGSQISEVAKLLGKSRRVVYFWIAAYLKEHAPEALFESPRTGRPIAAQQITDKHILSALKRNPLKLGYNSTVWTVSLLAAHLNAQFGASISPRTLYRRMIAMGLRCKRPRYVYSEKDPNRAQKKGRLSER